MGNSNFPIKIAVCVSAASLNRNDSPDIDGFEISTGARRLPNCGR